MCCFVATEDRIAAGTAPVRKCRPEYVDHIRFKFSALAHKLTVLSEKFPVLQSREFHCKPLDLLVSSPSNSVQNMNFAKFPVNSLSYWRAVSPTLIARTEEVIE